MFLVKFSRNSYTAVQYCHFYLPVFLSNCTFNILRDKVKCNHFLVLIALISICNESPIYSRFAFVFMQCTCKEVQNVIKCEDIIGGSGLFCGYSKATRTSTANLSKRKLLCLTRSNVGFFGFIDTISVFLYPVCGQGRTKIGSSRVNTELQT